MKYHFLTIDNLKKAAYRQADRLHTQYMMNTPPGQNPILGIGMNYIRFASNRLSTTEESFGYT